MNTGMVLVNYNDLDSLMKLLDNIKDYNVIKEIVIVDNNSCEDVKKELKKLDYSNVKVISLEENKGYSYGINIGSKYLIDKYGKCNIIVSNTDVIINDEKDIKTLLKALINKKVGIVAPVILENNTLNRGWKETTIKDEIMMNLLRIHRKYRKKHILYSDEFYKNDVSQVDVVSGCFFIIKSDVLKEINYMDENVFLYYEENILCKKIKDISKKVYIVNLVMVIHNHSISIDKSVDRYKKYRLQKKSQEYYVKNYIKYNYLQLIILKFTKTLTGFVLSFYYKISK